MAVHPDTQVPSDNRHVALIKSLATNNRFYALVRPESGLRNADTVDRIPDDLLLGIAYPCLEDGLNDFAVIRTTYETLDVFPEDDEEMRGELMQIVHEARGKLVCRLAELRDRVAARRAHFLGTDLEEFKSYMLDIVHRGYPRRNLDSMMKLNVFGSVAAAEGHANGSEPLYRYDFRCCDELPSVSQLSAREFVASLFADVLDSVEDPANYASRYMFDRNVFQKFIALMFVNYATTDPIFYGTNKADYGVSGEKDMNQTPLYVAIGRELREIEIGLAQEDQAEAGLVCLPKYEPAEPVGALEGQRTVRLPGALINEDVLLGPIASICAAAQKLGRRRDRETAEFGRIILSNASRLVQELKSLGIVPPFANDPGAAQSTDERPGSSEC